MKMGTFAGHALPGSFFIVFSLWHVLRITVIHFRYQRGLGPAFKAQTYFVSPCCGKMPLESFLKLAGIGVGFIGELLTAFRDGEFVNMGNAQHMCMFTFFGISSFLEIMSHYKVYLPDGLLYSAYILSFLIEALLFYWHLHIQDPLETQIHMFLLYLVAATIVSLVIEMNHRRSYFPALCRSFFVLLQGIWFWQAGFILFPPAGWPQWDWKSHKQMMVVTIIFCADCVLGICIVMTIWFSVACRYNMCRPMETNGKRNQCNGDVANGDIEKTNNHRSGHSYHTVQSDEEEIELMDNYIPS